MAWEYKVSIVCLVISFLCKLGVIYLKSMEKPEGVEEIPMNRAQRRHPNGMVPAQKFQRVSVKGRQKQGNGKAVRGW